MSSNYNSLSFSNSSSSSNSQLLSSSSLITIADLFSKSYTKKARSSFLSQIFAFFLLKIKNTLNYKSSYLMVLSINLMAVFSYFLFGQLNPDLLIFGIPATYFQYVIIGLSLQMVVGTALGTVNNSIYSEILLGTWSYVFTYFKLFRYTLGVSLAGILLSSFSIFLSFFISFIFLDLTLSVTVIQSLLVLLTFLLILASHIVLGMLFAAYSIWYKKDSGIIGIIYELTKTFSGIVFPLALLSGLPHIISKIVPLSYGLHSVQHIIFSPTLDFQLLMFNFLFLISFIFVIGGFAHFLVNFSIHKSKLRGDIGWY